MSILERLKAGENIRDILASASTAEINAAFQEAASSGDLGLLNLIFEAATPDQKQEMIEVNNFAAFCDAASNGDRDMVSFLLREAEQINPDLKRAMIEAPDMLERFVAFCYAASNEHIGVVRFLLEEAGKINPALKQQMIASILPSSSDLVHIIVGLRGLRDAPDPNYKGSLNSFVKRVMQETHLAVSQALQGYDFLTPQEKETIADDMARKVGFHVAINNGNIRDAREAAAARFSKNTALARGAETTIEHLPPEILMKILREIVPNISRVTPEELSNKINRAAVAIDPAAINPEAIKEEVANIINYTIRWILDRELLSSDGIYNFYHKIAERKVDEAAREVQEVREAAREVQEVREATFVDSARKCCHYIFYNF